ncbi:efflux RND transporter periplasmic adaptor subunit [Winogradskyella alexanderae]|uniref:Efflux RND transporter periplasmic adaptor subunit n=1 Tax=Winogradskyella alexanderae TaxID=2877123 RepID=A0ABS7XR02_9FLAO|nr:efflux RND transporter periplasmic adaptor subunit [Winogradskyella alexanderae]MCA0131392.1 efflux RND transporter periplasmic adaptor subunit [Winogradskyella alexanderae]
MKRIQHKVLVALIFLFAISCGKKENETSIVTKMDDGIKISKAQFEANKMTFTQIETKSFPLKIKVNGMIDVPPENKAIVNSPMGGYITRTPLLEGDTVAKGAFLVALENPDFVTLQQNYMETKAQLDYQRAEYDRHKTMREENVISEKSYIKAKSDYNAVKAKYNGLRKQLEMLNISVNAVESGKITSIINLYAPISGSITKVNVNKGTYVSPANSILEIINNEHIHLELSVFEKDILNVKKGQKITFTIPEASNQTYEAEVYLVGTTLDENRTIKVHGHPKDESVKFLTGMFVNAEILIASKSGNALLSDAIVEEDNNNFILVLDRETELDYYFTKRKIEIGLENDGFTEIKENKGLNPEDRILHQGAFGLIGI